MCAFARVAGDEQVSFEDQKRFRRDILRDRITFLGRRHDDVNLFVSDLRKLLDRNRLEQELIFYIEKIDISEEQVRLKNHCEYFKDVLKENTISKGKKLSFILQEIGREINTTGSKAYDSDIQKCVVLMKDELEKAKEQILNVL